MGEQQLTGQIIGVLICVKDIISSEGELAPALHEALYLSAVCK